MEGDRVSRWEITRQTPPRVRHRCFTPPSLILPEIHPTEAESHSGIALSALGLIVTLYSVMYIYSRCTCNTAFHHCGWKVSSTELPQDSATAYHLCSRLHNWCFYQWRLFPKWNIGLSLSSSWFWLFKQCSWSQLSLIGCFECHSFIGQWRPIAFF